MEVEVRTVDADRMRMRGIDIKTEAKNIRVAYLTGPLFFAATNTFNEAFAHEEDVDFLILSMRAVPLIDLSGIEALTGLAETLHAQDKTLMLAGVNPKVMYMLQRAGADLLVGKDNFFWSADRAILVAEQRHLHLTHVETESEIEVSGEPAMTAMPL
jgi:SulP family sulfate permease